MQMRPREAVRIRDVSMVSNGCGGSPSNGRTAATSPSVPFYGFCRLMRRRPQGGGGAPCPWRRKARRRATARTACTNARHYFACGEVEWRRWYFGSNCSSMKASLIVMGVKVGPATVRRCRAPQRRERPTVDFTLPSTQPESRTATSVRASACEATAVAVQDAQLLGQPPHAQAHRQLPAPAGALPTRTPGTTCPCLAKQLG